MKNTRDGIVLCFILLLLSLYPHSVAAAIFLGGQTAFFSASTEEDVYLAGGKVVADQKMGGDLVAAGGTLLVNGPVAQDLIIAGGNITVNGPVGDDLRATGGEINITETVGDDLIVAGGSITISSGVTVEGDLVAMGGSIIVAGTVMGNVRAIGGDIIVHGAIHGTSDLRAYKRLEIASRLEGDATFAAPQVILGKGAGFGGKVEYWQKEGELDFSGLPTAGPVTYNPQLKFDSLCKGPDDWGKYGRRGALGVVGLWFGFAVFSGALLIFILVVGATDWFKATGERLQNKFWRKFGYGLVYFLLMPMLALVLFISVIGAPLGLFVLALYGFSLLFAAPITAMVLAKWLETRRVGLWSKPLFFLVSLLLFILLRLLLLVPAIGWIAAGIFICAAYGAILEPKLDGQGALV